MTGRVAIVIASGKGMGAACARALHAAGYSLGLISRSDDAAQLAQELGNAVGIKGSVTDEKDLQRLFETVLDRFGRLNCVVNNTGHPPKGDLDALSLEHWQTGYDLILKTVLKTTELALPHLLKQRTGSIVNISSFAGLEPSLDFPISSAMRSALTAYTKLFSKRYAKDGLRMNCVMPGFVDSFPVNEKFLAQIPAGRYAKVDEVANLVTFLAGDTSAYINGESIRIDGGLSRSL